MKHAKEQLPAGYRLNERIDLVKNRKQMLLVNGLALGLAVLLVVLGILVQPQGAADAFDLEKDPLSFAIKCFAVAAASILYIIGHEAVHGVFMWHFSHRKPNFGFSFTYAYAGSDMYFGKKAYLIIALAPVVVWGVILGVLSAVLPAEWFWVVWIIQITNISGAAGDFYVFFRMLKKPHSVLVQDTGTAMSVYLPA